MSPGDPITWWRCLPGQTQPMPATFIRKPEGKRLDAPGTRITIKTEDGALRIVPAASVEPRRERK